MVCVKLFFVTFLLDIRNPTPRVAYDAAAKLSVATVPLAPIPYAPSSVSRASVISNAALQMLRVHLAWNYQWQTLVLSFL